MSNDLLIRDELNPREHNPLYKDKTFLAERYYTDLLSPTKIGKLCGVSRDAITGQMRRKGMKFRSASEARVLNIDERPFWNKEWLEDRYLKQKISIYGLCKLSDCCPKVLKYWFGKHNIKIRPKSEADKLRRKTDLRRRYGHWLNRLLLVIKDTVKSFDKSCEKYF